jgi:hypothetical protein
LIHRIAWRPIGLDRAWGLAESGKATKHRLKIVCWKIRDARGRNFIVFVLYFSDCDMPKREA